MKKVLKLNDIAVVIVNYNKCELLLKCLEHVNLFENVPETIIVVDNNSCDNSVAAVKEKYRNVILIENKSNIGGAAGFNCGIKRALETECEYVYLMDNDVEPERNALEELLKALRLYENAAAAGSKGFYCFDRSVIWQAGCMFSWLLQVKIHRENGRKDSEKHNRIESVDYMPAFSLLVRRSAICDVGLMDERFYIYMDDADWCFRMRENNWKILYVPSSKVYHHVSAEIPSPFSIYYSTRNFLLLFKKHCSQNLLFFMYFLSILKNIIKMCVYTFKRIKLKKGEYRSTVFSFFHAYIDFFSDRFGRSDLY